jgi:hypothetical protein
MRSTSDGSEVLPPWASPSTTESAHVASPMQNVPSACLPHGSALARSRIQGIGSVRHGPADVYAAQLQMTVVSCRTAPPNATGKGTGGGTGSLSFVEPVSEVIF